MKRSILILGAIFFLVAGGVFADKAADPSDVLEARYNEAGQLNFTAAASLNFYGFSPVVGIEYIMGPIDFIPSFPMEWGLGVKGIFDIYFFTGYSGFGGAAAPVATLHKGLNFGEKLEFDVCVSAGLGLYGGTYHPGFNLGFATFETVSWKLNEGFWIIADYGYIGWQSVYGLGIKLEL